MSKGNTFETDLLEHIFQDVALPVDYGGPFYVSLHTADPGEAGDQTTNEVAYTGYARVSVARTAGGWTVTGNTAENAAQILFGQCTGGSATATHVAIGTAASGAGILMYSGALSQSLAISTNITPSIAAGDIVATETGWSNTFATDLLEFIFNATALPAAYAGPYYVALHTADPTAAGDQTNSECAYTGYGRVSIARSAAGWNVASNNASNVNAVNTGECTAGSETATHFSVGTAASGSGIQITQAALDSSLAISAGITPEFGADELDITAD